MPLAGPLLAALVGLAVIFVVGNVWLETKTRRLREERRGETGETFVQACLARGATPLVARAVLGNLDWVGFPVRLEDRLDQDLGIVDEDLDDLVLESARDCGCRELTSEDVAGFRVRTVADVVRLLGHLVRVAPRLQDPPAEGGRTSSRG